MKNLNKNQLLEQAKAYTDMFNNAMSSAISWKPIGSDPGKILETIFDQMQAKILIKFAYIENGILKVDGGVVMEVDKFIDYSEAIVLLKLYSDTITDWWDDREAIFTKQEYIQLDNIFFTDPDIVTVFPIAAFLFDDDSVFETDLMEIPSSSISVPVPPATAEEQNMAIEDCDEYEIAGNGYPEPYYLHDV